MATIHTLPVPPDSLLAAFGDERDYRDCFARDEPGAVSLARFLERFYRSLAFTPERAILRLIGSPASRATASALAHGEAERFAVWKVVYRRDNEILMESRETGTASWFKVEQRGNATRLYFGSWVGNFDQSGWKALEGAHVWYSKFLLNGV
ncbi:MAG: hypothetical protein AAFR88_12950 [Pseudomonadota bacterium]